MPQRAKKPRKFSFRGFWLFIEKVWRSAPGGGTFSFQIRPAGYEQLASVMTAKKAASAFLFEPADNTPAVRTISLPNND